MNFVASPLEAVRLISSGERIFVHGAAMTPTPLLEALCARADELESVEIVQLHTEGPAPYTDPKYARSFRTRSLFVGANIRESIGTEMADYVPIFLSDVPRAIKQGILPIDTALIQVSPPDRHGYCSLGVSVDAAYAATLAAKKRIALVNRKAPRTHGDGVIHIDQLTAMCEVDTDLYAHDLVQPTEVEKAIGYHVASLVEDGATLQVGIGGIPNAVLAELTGHRRLGVHTEMCSDGVIDLVERGCITGEEKRVLPGKLVTSFALGSTRLYRFIDDNPLVVMRECSFTNDTATIRQNPKVTAINSAIEVDLTGQVVADSIGTRQYSGVGGQMDFIRGASLSEGGKPIIALPSVTSNGISRIVSTIREGAGVTTTRAHVGFVATEYGVADLFGRSLRERAKLLIALAHPEHRERLSAEAKRRKLL